MYLHLITLLMLMLWIYVVVLGCANVVYATVKLPENETIPAMFVFGDSIVDSGNNNGLQTLVKSNYPPYGKDFIGHVPTGRFSNGKVLSDIIAEELGISKLSPAYLNPNFQATDLPTGANFASSGSGYDPETPNFMRVLSMSDQLNNFKSYKEKLRGNVGEEKAEEITGKGLYVVEAGNNDLAIAYFLTNLRRLQYDVTSYVNFLVSQASQFLKDLHGEGARRIAVLSTVPLGCLPGVRTLAGGPGRECAAEYGEAAEMFNAKLSSEVDRLKAKLLDAKMVFVDIYNPLLQFIQNPEKYGFDVADRGCCGAGALEAAELCYLAKHFTCTNSSRYVFWDSAHPTEETNRILASQILQKSINQLFSGSCAC